MSDPRDHTYAEMTRQELEASRRAYLSLVGKRVRPIERDKAMHEISKIDAQLRRR